MTLQIRAFDDPAELLERAGGWLMAREVEHNLILGIMAKLQEGEGRTDAPVYLAALESGEGVVGCAFRTPPYPLALTRLPAEAAEALAESVGAVYESLPGVNGPTAAVAAFAEAWCELRGTSSRGGQKQRIYRLTELKPPDRPVPGCARPATEDDVPLLVEWWGAFAEEAGVPVGDPERTVPARLEEDRLMVWDDQGMVSMAGISGLTPNGARIGPVYTPPESRGQGYGTALTAAITARCLKRGRRFCCLYTDLANPTSNKIYQGLGYQPLLDVELIHFDEDSVDGRSATEGSA